MFSDLIWRLSLSTFVSKNSLWIFTWVIKKDPLSASSMICLRVGGPELHISCFYYPNTLKGWFYYNLFFTFIPALSLLIILLSKLCLLNVLFGIIISQIHILHLLRLHFISSSLLVTSLDSFVQVIFFCELKVVPKLQPSTKFP